MIVYVYTFNEKTLTANTPIMGVPTCTPDGKDHQERANGTEPHLNLSALILSYQFNKV